MAAASAYFKGPKPGVGGKAASLAANENPPKVAPEPRTIKVRAHTRAAPKKPVAAAQERVPLPPSLNPKADKRFVNLPSAPTVAQVKPPSTPRPTPANTQRLEPATRHGTSQRFYRPLQPGQKPSGYEAVGRRPGRAGIGSPVTSRPYWLATRGAAGDQGAQLSSAQLVAAQRAGVHPTIPMAVLSSTVHPLTDLSRQAQGLRPFSARGAVSDVANIASQLVPAGKVGAAGVFGLRGLKALRGARVAAEAAPQVIHATPEAAAVREALKGAPTVRGGQAAGYSAQRGSKAAQVEKIYRDASLTPAEREAKADAVLKGELERPTFMGFKKLTPDAVTNLKSQIMGHGTLRTFQKKTLLNSLNRAVAGKVPTAGEQKLFEQTFGKSVSAGIAQAAQSGRWKNIATNVVNVPRTLQATADLSAFLRQGFVALGRHPVITGKNFVPMVKAYASEDVARGIEREIAARPNFPLMKAGKVAFTGGNDVSPHEEQFAAHMLEAIGGTKNPIRWSSRAYSTFLNKTRADVFDHLAGVAQAQGKNVHDEGFLKDLGEMVNVFTGRGGLPADLERAANVFNGLFFSPRLMTSRLKMLGQPFNLALARRNPFVYKQYLRAFTQSFGGLATVLALAKLNGLDVGTNPRSSDFGKIKFGNTRVDLGAGFLQYFHLLGTLGTRQYKSSTTGKVYGLGGGFGQKSAYAVLDDFFGNKLSPPASAIRDLLKQQTNYGPYSPRQEATARLLPLVWQDVHDIYKEHGGGQSRILPAAAGGGLAILGGGIQTYGPRPPKPSTRKPQTYFSGSRSGGGSPYFAPPSKSGAGGGYFARP